MTHEKRYCLRCGRELKSKESRQLGFGPSCYKKYLADKKGGLLKYLEQNKGGKDDISSR